MMTTQQDVWSANKKKPFFEYVPKGKDLKLIWENAAKVERILSLLKSFRDVATEESTSFSFAGKTKNVLTCLNIASKKHPRVSGTRPGFNRTLSRKLVMNLFWDMRWLTLLRIVLLVFFYGF